MSVRDEASSAGTAKTIVELIEALTSHEIWTAWNFGRRLSGFQHPSGVPPGDEHLSPKGAQNSAQHVLRRTAAHNP